MECSWQYAHPFDAQGMAAVAKDDKWGWINREGEVVVPLEWDSVNSFDSHDMGMIERDRRYGWINRSGEVVIEPQFLQMGQKFAAGESSGWESPSHIYYSFDTEPFEPDGLALVRKINRWYWIDRTGEEVFPKWANIVSFGPNGLAPVYKDGQWGYINRDGEVVIQPQWDLAGHFGPEGLARVSAHDAFGFGWIDETGAEAIPVTWSGTSEFFNGLAIVANPSAKDLGEIFGQLMKASGETVPEWNSDDDDWTELGLINTSGEIVLSLDGDWDMDYFDKHFLATKMDSPTGTRKALHWIRNLFSDDNSVFDTDRILLARTYDGTGKLIWSSEWLRYEWKCYFVLGFALILALFVRPRRSNPSSLADF